MKVERHLELKSPFDALEAAIVRRSILAEDDVGPALVGVLRYIVSFCRLTLVRNRDGRDVDLSGYLAPHAWKVRSVLAPALSDDETGLWAAIRELPSLVSLVRSCRREILARFPLDRESLEEEICERHFVVAAGGGGGAGYGYAGAYTLLNRVGIQPSLLAGTSIGALISLFRARRRQFDMAAMFEAGRRLTLGGVFKVLEPESQYGLPAMLRLHLKPTLGNLFLDDDGLSMRMSDLQIPMRIVTTGLTSDALRPEIAFNEQFLDEAVTAEPKLSRAGWRRMTQVVQVLRDLMATPEIMREIVFGEDELTSSADVLDAAGFSASIPGLIHYDVIRDDPRMLGLLDRLYMAHGISRLAEGGLVENVPARVAYEAVMNGAIGRRNIFVLAMDCFSPQPRSFMYFPLQQVVRQNVLKSIAYAHLYFPLRRTLNPVNMVPAIGDIQEAMRWTMKELNEHLPFMKGMCAPIPVLDEGGTSG